MAEYAAPDLWLRDYTQICAASSYAPTGKALIVGNPSSETFRASDCTYETRAED